ncbi:hypothetical protein PRUPE_6G158200 [Prunus persica]|uniref:Uncharacterized protein n=1 Tax=Prunus persica TaxID=3760 RepID=M5W4R5_PRUPE|nr:hypothetical protein PRUPE_6G158200 [Prunus persica]
MSIGLTMGLAVAFFSGKRRLDCFVTTGARRSSSNCHLSESIFVFTSHWQTLQCPNLPHFIQKSFRPSYFKRMRRFPATGHGMKKPGANGLAVFMSMSILRKTPETCIIGIFHLHYCSNSGSKLSGILWCA